MWYTYMCTVEPAMPCRHLSCLYTFNFSIQLKSFLQGPIPTIVGPVATPFLESIGHWTLRSPISASPQRSCLPAVKTRFFENL